MKNFFLDTNIMLDFLMQRAPFALAAAELFQLAEERKIGLYGSSLSISHAHYILRKVVGSATAATLLLDMAGLITIVAVDAGNVNEALQSSFNDFEDALQYSAARAVPAIEAIVTRDPRGFAPGALPVLTPPQALGQLAY